MRLPPHKPFAKDQRGVSAVEFALVTPALLIILLGLGDVVPAVIARYQVTHMTAAFADVTTEYSELQTSDMANLFSAATDVLAPESSASLSLRLTNIYSDGAGHAYVYWSCGQGSLPAYAANSAISTTPTGSPVGWFLWQYNTAANGYTLNGTNTSYVMAESTYSYTSPTQFIIKQPLAFSSTAYLLPRQSSYVGFPWDGVSTDAPTAPTAATQTASVTLTNGAVCNYIH